MHGVAMEVRLQCPHLVLSAGLMHREHMLLTRSITPALHSYIVPHVRWSVCVNICDHGCQAARGLTQPQERQLRAEACSATAGLCQCQK